MVIKSYVNGDYTVRLFIGQGDQIDDAVWVQTTHKGKVICADELMFVDDEALNCYAGHVFAVGKCVAGNKFYRKVLHSREGA